MASNATSSERMPAVMARAMPHGRPAPAAVAAALAPLAAAMGDAANTAGSRVEARDLHRFRVAMRRSRSLLAAFKALFDKPTRRRFRKDFAWLNSSTGRLRDLDVLLGALEQPAHENDVPECVRTFVRARREEEHWRALRLFNSPRYIGMMREWSQALDRLAQTDEAADGDVSVAIGRALARQLDRVTRHIAHWQDEPDYTALHRVRKDLKRLRYLIDGFTELFPARDLERVQHDLKGLQDLLGAVCDRHAQYQLVRGWLMSSLVASDDALSAALTAFAATLHPAAPATTARTLAQRLQDFRARKNRARYARLRRAAMA